MISKTSMTEARREKHFSKKEALRFGWNSMKSHFGFFVLLLLAMLLISGVPDLVSAELDDSAPALAVIVSIAGAILSIIAQIGSTKISLKFVDGDTPQLNDLFAYANLFFKYVGASLLYLLIVLGGLVLLIVPGVIWAIKFGFYSYIIIDTGARPVAALKQSAILTRGAKPELFLFAVILGLVNVAGAFALLVGLFATIPATMVAAAYVYRRLQERVPPTPPAPTISLERPQ